MSNRFRDCSKMTEKNIKNRVKLARVEKELTQEELAKKIGVTRQTIGLIEKQEYNPTLLLCLQLSCVLGKDIDQLFWLEVKGNEE